MKALWRGARIFFIKQIHIAASSIRVDWQKINQRKWTGDLNDELQGKDSILMQSRIWTTGLGDVYRHGKWTANV
jgi:fido (protein-threonine AMPylation protein)